MSESSQIDILDRKILDIITKNARIPYLEVARECNVSGAAIHQRVQRMIRTGVIKGSEFKIDHARVGFGACAYIGIFLDAPANYKETVLYLKDIHEVVECHCTTGHYSFMIKVYARDNEHLRDIIINKIHPIKGITRTETLISLEESINRQAPLLVEEWKRMQD